MGHLRFGGPSLDRPPAFPRILNDKGLARRNGQPWSQRQVAAILDRSLLYRDGMLRYGEVNGQDKGLALWEERGVASGGAADST